MRIDASNIVSIVAGNKFLSDSMAANGLQTEMQYAALLHMTRSPADTVRAHGVKIMRRMRELNVEHVFKNALPGSRLHFIDDPELMERPIKTSPGMCENIEILTGGACEPLMLDNRPGGVRITFACHTKSR